VTLYEKDAATALTQYARKILATEIVVTRGRGRRGNLRKLIELLTDVDIHVLPNPRENNAARALRDGRRLGTLRRFRRRRG
jgi:K+-sensing histidine kinase KdpD